MRSLLLFGGNSDERLVSVASAQNLAQKFAFTELWFMHFDGGLSKVGKAELVAHEKPFENEFKPKKQTFARDLNAALDDLRRLAVFIGMHGTQGEDGQLQSWLEKNKIPFTGSGSVASGNCFDKVKAKKILREKGGSSRLAGELLLSKSEKMTWPMRVRNFFSQHGGMVIKPVANGSSVGLHIVRSADQLEAAVKAVTASTFGDYLIEKFLEGRELTVGVLEQVDGKRMALPPSETVLQAGFSFDYQGKYLGRGTTEITPAKISAEDKRAAQDLALLAHKTLGCRGYSRTDMILTSDGPYFLETNTLPGLTKASFIPQQLEAARLTVPDFIEEQLEIAVKKASVEGPRAGVYDFSADFKSSKK